MRYLLVSLLVLAFIGGLAGCGQKESTSKKKRKAVAAPASPKPDSEQKQPAAEKKAPAKSSASESKPESEPASRPTEQPKATNPSKASGGASAKISDDDFPSSDSAVTKSSSNLQKIAAAMGSYHGKEKRFPPAVLYHEDKPVLSWRVALLPYLGQLELYKQFKLTEPWDGPTNKPLVDKIPAVYQSPGRAVDGKTCYLVPAGMGTIFGQRDGIAQSLIGDGLDKTLLIVEANEERAVPWTQPEDLRYFPAQPLSGLGKLRKDRFLAAFANGTVRTLPMSLEPTFVQSLFTANGRERIDLRALDQLLAKPTGAADGKSTPPRMLPSKRQGEAIDLLVRGDQRRALTMLLAECSRGNLDVLQSMKWSRGLRRPALMLRCGVVVQAPGVVATSDSAPPPPRNPRKPNLGPILPAATNEALPYWGAEFGKPMLDKLQQALRGGGFGDWLRTSSSRSTNSSSADMGEKKPSPQKFINEGGILNMQLMEANQARRAAAREGLDVLIMAGITTKGAKIGGVFRPQSTLSVRILDVVKDEIIWTSKSANSTVSGAEKGAADQEGAVRKQLLTDVVGYLESEVWLGEMPKFTTQSVQRRAESIALRSSDPLPILAELRYYQIINLLTPEQLEEFYSRVIGQELGRQLATGSDVTRQQALDRLLGLDREL